MVLYLLLLVKNEADIIETNIRWHLEMGVDRIIVTDNGSTDGTADILRDLHDNDTLRLIEDDKPFYQSKMMTRMALMAKDEGADWVIPSDADELWTTTTGTLKSALAPPKYNMAMARVINHVTTYLDDETDPDPVRRMDYAVVRPLNIPKAPEVLKPPQRKAALRTRDLIAVCEGNHWADMTVYRDNWNTPLEIHHYPLRSWEQFQAKVINGAPALIANGDLPECVGYHWRRWYRAYQRGRLRREWRRMTLSAWKILALTTTGVVRRRSVY